MLLFVTSSYCRLSSKICNFPEDKAEFFSKTNSIFHVGYIQHEMNIVYENYANKTKTSWGLFKSFVPFTAAYKAKKSCEQVFDKTETRLKIAKKMWKYRNDTSDIQYKKFIAANAQDEEDNKHLSLIKPALHETESMENPYVSPLLTKRRQPEREEKNITNYQAHRLHQ